MTRENLSLLLVAGTITACSMVHVYFVRECFLSYSIHWFIEGSLLILLLFWGSLRLWSHLISCCLFGSWSQWSYLLFRYSGLMGFLALVLLQLLQHVGSSQYVQLLPWVRGAALWKWQCRMWSGMESTKQNATHTLTQRHADRQNHGNPIHHAR